MFGVTSLTFVNRRTLTQPIWGLFDAALKLVSADTCDSYDSLFSIAYTLFYYQPEVLTHNEDRIQALGTVCHKALSNEYIDETEVIDAPNFLAFAAQHAKTAPTPLFTNYLPSFLQLCYTFLRENPHDSDDIRLHLLVTFFSCAWYDVDITLQTLGGVGSEGFLAFFGQAFTLLKDKLKKKDPRGDLTFSSKKLDLTIRHRKALVVGLTAVLTRVGDQLPNQQFYTNALKVLVSLIRANSVECRAKLKEWEESKGQEEWEEADNEGDGCDDDGAEETTQYHAFHQGSNVDEDEDEDFDSEDENDSGNSGWSVLDTLSDVALFLEYVTAARQSSIAGVVATVVDEKKTAAMLSKALETSNQYAASNLSFQKERQETGPGSEGLGPSGC